MEYADCRVHFSLGARRFSCAVQSESVRVQTAKHNTFTWDLSQGSATAFEVAQEDDLPARVRTVNVVVSLYPASSDGRGHEELFVAFLKEYLSEEQVGDLLAHREKEERKDAANKEPPDGPKKDSGAEVAEKPKKKIKKLTNQQEEQFKIATLRAEARLVNELAGDVRANVIWQSTQPDRHGHVVGAQLPATDVWVENDPLGRSLDFRTAL